MLALVPLVTALAPGLLDWLFGRKAGEAAAKVAAVVSSVTGADATTTEGAAAAQAVIQGNPDLALKLQSELLALKSQMQAEADREADQQRADDLAALQASLASVAGARQQTVDLVRAGSVIAYGAPVMSAVVLVAFGVMAWLVMFRAVPPGSETLAAGVLEALKLLSVTVVGYWCGSSAGSARKDERLAQVAASQAPPTP